jgi:hypothetical protein
VIERQRAGADQRGQLAGRAATREVHLKEAILRVQKSQCSRDILARGAVYGGDAESIALDAHRRGQPGDLMRAVQLREARANLVTHPEGAGDCCDQDDEKRHQQRFEQAAHDFGML